MLSGFACHDEGSSSANPSLPLHEVLETEFAVLHGKLPPEYPSSTEPNTRLKAIWAAVHELPEKRSALCISGGGIRARHLDWECCRAWRDAVCSTSSTIFHCLGRRIHRQLAERLD